MSLIFEETKTLTPNDTKTNVPLQFYVAEELEKMEIEFSYSPKNLDDEEKAHKYIDDGFEKYAPESYRKGYKPWYEYLPVKNLLTVSLDSPDGYIGCAHRQDSRQTHIISETESSRGFIKTRLPSGLYRITINVHALVTDECTFNIKVFGEVKSNA